MSVIYSFFEVMQGFSLNYKNLSEKYAIGIIQKSVGKTYEKFLKKSLKEYILIYFY